MPVTYKTKSSSTLKVFINKIWFARSTFLNYCNCNNCKNCLQISPLITKDQQVTQQFFRKTKIIFSHETYCGNVCFRTENHFLQRGLMWVSIILNTHYLSKVLSSALWAVGCICWIPCMFPLTSISFFLF